MLFTLVPIGIFLLLLGPQLLIAQTTSSDQMGDTSQGGSLSPLFYLVVVVLGAVGSCASWWARTYTVGPDELVIDEGVFTRRRRVVPYGRLQQIDIDQKLLAQVLRLATLTIETAGSGGGKVRLGMLDVGLARGIRRYTLERRAQINAAGKTPVDGGAQRPVGASGGVQHAGFPSGAGMPQERVLLRLSTGRLVVAGLTHHFVAAGVPTILVGGLAVGAVMVPGSSGTSVLAVILGALLVATLIAAGLTIIVFIQYVIGQHGYTLVEQGDDLHMRFGLFQVRNVTIPRHRVQHVTVSDNPLRRALGLVSIHLHSAASTNDVNGTWLATFGASSAGGQQASFEIPVLARADVDGFLTAFLGGDWQIPVLTPRPPAARRRAVTRRLGVLAAVMVVPAWMFPPGSFALLTVALIGIPWGLAAHRRAGHGRTASNIVLSRGVLHHRIDLVPLTKVQSAACISSPLQRFSKLRTLRVDVAGTASAPSLFDMAQDPATFEARRLPRSSLNARPGRAATNPVYGQPSGPA